MKRIIIIVTSGIFLYTCNGGQSRNNADSASAYPPSVLNDTNNANAGNGAANSRMPNTTRKQDGTPIQGDTSTSNNGQNTGIIKDMSKHKRKQ